MSKVALTQPRDLQGPHNCSLHNCSLHNCNAACTVPAYSRMGVMIESRIVDRICLYKSSSAVSVVHRKAAYMKF